MIERITDAAGLCGLPESGIEANKIRALLRAYGTGYDFCRFYRQECAFLSQLDGSWVLCGEADFEELAPFLIMSGFSELFCTTEAAQALCKQGNFARHDLNLMIFRRCESEDFCACDLPDLDFSPPLSEVYEILKTGFDVPFEPWYLDMSHRVRHGVTRFAAIDGSCLCVQHEQCSEALLSQIATLPELRGQGRASRLIRAVCARISAREIMLVCEDALVPFYERAGFAKSGKRSVVAPRG